MAWWNKSQRVPSDITTRLERSERVLAWAQHQGGFIAATTVGLLSTDSHEEKKIPWTSILAAKWEDPLLTIALAPDLSALAWIVPQAGMLPVAVRDRVTAHVLVDRMRKFGDVDVRFIAHRTSAGVEWITIAQDPVWAATDIGRSSIDAELASLRANLGI